MSFIRLSDNYMDHPKFARLSDGAFRLWHRVMAHCRTYQTDGLVELAILRGFKEYSPKRLRELSEMPGRSVLLESVDGVGFKVHDYLEWNLSRDEEQSDRVAATARMRRFRRARDGVRDASHGGGSDAFVPGTDRIGSDPDSEKVEKDHGETAARFLERYQALYAEHRHGARLHIKPSLDWTRVCDLLQTWDVARLEKLAVILLTTDDEWVKRTDRGIGVFAARASWLDGLLTAWEISKGVTV